MTRITVLIERFHPLTVTYPDLEVIPAGSELFIQLPPIRIDFGPAMLGLIDQHVVADYPLYGMSMTLAEDRPLGEMAKFIVSGDMPKYLEQAWETIRDEVAKAPLAKEAPRELALLAMARSLGVEL